MYTITYFRAHSIRSAHPRLRSSLHRSSFPDSGNPAILRPSLSPRPVALGRSRIVALEVPMAGDTDEGDAIELG
jgi:hypothetical protein